MTGVPTRAEVDALRSADAHTLGLLNRHHWVLVWVWPLERWRLVYDPPSRTTPEVGRNR